MSSSPSSQGSDRWNDHRQTNAFGSPWPATILSDTQLLEGEEEAERQRQADLRSNHRTLSAPSPRSKNSTPGGSRAHHYSPYGSPTSGARGSSSTTNTRRRNTMGPHTAVHNASSSVSETEQTGVLPPSPSRTRSSATAGLGGSMSGSPPNSASKGDTVRRRPSRSHSGTQEQTAGKLFWPPALQHKTNSPLPKPAPPPPPTPPPKPYEPRYQPRSFADIMGDVEGG